MKKVFTTVTISVLLFSVLSGQAIHVVNSMNDNDDGVCNGLHCSLREALNASNTNIGPDSIEFNIPGAGLKVITVNSTLPDIVDPFLVIDGTTQPNNFPMAGLVVIDGSNLGPGPNHGLVIYAPNTEVYGMQIRNFPADGIQLFGTLPDLFLSSIIIGTPGKGNVIIRNGGYGIDAPIDRNVSIQSNYIGTDLQFNPGLGNGWDGIFVNVLTGTNVVIGGSRSLIQQNYLCSNGFSGLRVVIENAAQFAPGFAITGNIIGTDLSGVQNLGNAGMTFGGIQAGGGISVLGAGPLSIGGAAGLSNIIAFNYAGVYTDMHNRKTILENFFYCNSYKGIHLANNANNGILPPAILCLQGSTLVGDAPPGMMIDVYLHNDAICPGVACQGLTLLGRVNADAVGSWNLDVSAWPGGQFTALAQDPLGNTSEFAACILDPNVLASNTGPYCFGDSIFLLSELDTAVGNVTFEWLGPDGYTSTLQNPMDATLPGIYTVVANIMGCGADSAYTEVIVYPLASDTIRDICVDDSVIVNGVVYNDVNTFGQEILVGAGQHGCDSLVVIELEFHPPSIGRILSTRPRACAGDSVGYWFDLNGESTFYDVVFTTGTGQPDTAFNVYDGFGDTLIVMSDVHFEILDIITDQDFCEPVILPSDSILVSELSIAPVVSDYSGYNVSCFGENDGLIALNVTGAVGIVNYDWNLAALNTDMVTQLSAGNYSVTVTDGAGCSITYSTLITQPPMFESISRTEATTCPGVNDGAIFIDAILGARGPVEYSINGAPFASIGVLPFQISNLTPGPLILELMDSSGCIDELSLFIPLGENPGIDLGSERSILSGDSVLLDFNTTILPEQIQWEPSEVLSCPTCPTTYAFPSESQYITLTLTDSSGCSVKDSILILVFVPKKVFIPTVFSPNGDQINDVFYIQANEFAEEIEYIIVADRWGDVVFEGTKLPVNDPEFGWDGTLDGKGMFPAVFTYLARIRFSDEVLPYSGTVTLIR